MLVVHGTSALSASANSTCVHTLTEMQGAIDGRSAAAGPSEYCFWRIEPALPFTRVFFNTSYQNFEGGAVLDLYRVEAGSLVSLTNGRGFSALMPLPRGMVLHSGSAVLLVLLAMSNHTAFNMEYSASSDSGVISPWMLVWLASGLLVAAILCSVAGFLSYLFLRSRGHRTRVILHSELQRRRARVREAALVLERVQLEDRRSSALEDLPVIYICVYMCIHMYLSIYIYMYI